MMEGPMSSMAAQRRRVLIIEDESRLRELLVDVLPEMGYDPVAARTAEQAFSLLAERPADIVMLDLNLPVMDGLSFLDRFRERYADTPVIIMTGFGDVPAAQRAIRHNVVDFLAKPCHLGEIEAALDRARRRLSPVMPSLPDANDAPEAPAGEAEAPKPQTIAEVERQMIFAAIKTHAGNRTAAAEALGISRRTLYNKLAEYEQQGLRPE
ncbi:MAG: response regulator [Planctomycetes bacterium]|nr:response regulator [Planctomycetota bacterium]